MAQLDDVILARLDVVFCSKECFGAVTEDRIAAAEAELEVSFPRSYRLFLSRYGAAVGDGFEVAGLPNTRATDPEPPFWENVIDRTLRLRRVSRGHIPMDYVPLASDGTDYMFYLATRSVGSDGECPVVVLGPGLHDIEAASSFLDWIERANEGRPFPAEA